MPVDDRIAKFFLPDDDSWLKHANPWSVWTRFATLPFIVLAVWSRVWIGWYCIIPITALLVWVVVNPVLFKKPASFSSWGSRAVLGERVYVNRHEKPIPESHQTPIFILTILQTIGGVLLIFGLWRLSIAYTLYGGTVIYLSKMWFLDRMVWLYEDSK